MRPAALVDHVNAKTLAPTWQPADPRELEAIALCPPREMTKRITELAHLGIHHLNENDLRAAGVPGTENPTELHGRVPVWDNYLLYALSYLKPDTYNPYEFCDYRKVFERATGACGQKSVAVVSFLHEHGIRTGFVDWREHHAVGIAEVAKNEWWVLDPEYGITFTVQLTPAIHGARAGALDLSQALISARPGLEWLQHPTESMPIAASDLYPVTGQTIRFGGPEARWKRVYWIERATYVLKWVLPGLLLVIATILRARNGTSSIT